MIKILTFTLLMAATPAFSQSLPAEVTAPVEKIFVPHGFDDNDNAEVVIHGTFPDSCWRVGHSGATVDQENYKIEVWATAYQYSPENGGEDALCAQVMMPYLTSVKTGILKAGTYTITVKDLDITSSIEVGVATRETPDDYLYAMVDSAGVDVDPISGDQSLWVRGAHPHFYIGCMVIDEVRAFKSPENVLVVLPIGRMEEGEACEGNYKHNFFNRVKLENPITEESLLHVRVLSGRSYNELLHLN